ncbi:hypothetical protein ACI3EY_13005 [Ornithinimicrobium sp. LYQ92]|uniref:hypothetical protein n=1 Tax=Serinicoccus sp. LYQ92 TaxID=3378798 RepID=UPI0038549D17
MSTSTRVATPRFIDARSHAINTFASLESFLESPDVRPGVLTITHHELPLDVLFAPHPTATATIVIFHGAMSDTIMLPWLSGQSVTQDLPLHRIFISDPSLYLSEEMRLAWFAGSRHQPRLQADLLSVIRHLHAAVDGEQLLLLGGSGGGFAALLYGHGIPDSIAIAMNPQTDLSANHTNAYADYLRLAWDATSGTELPDTVTTDLCGRYAAGMDNRVVYMQNTTDEHHVTRHMQPFLERLTRPSAVDLHLDNWGPGHIPPPRAVIREVIGHYIS